MKLVHKGQSDFKKEMMLEEVEALNREFPLADSEFDFKIIYIIENDEDYEIEFYFRNNVDFDLALGELPLHLVYEKSVIGIKVVNFRRVFGVIPARSVVPCSFRIEKKSVYYPSYINQSQLRLGVNLEFKVEAVVEDDIVNMPDNLPYQQKLYFNEKIKALEPLVENSYDINTLAIDGDENGDVNIALLIRNGYEGEISIEKMPMALLNNNKAPIYFGTFESNSVRVEGRKSKIFLYKIAKESLIKTYDSYEDFTIEIKK